MKITFLSLPSATHQDLEKAVGSNHPKDVFKYLLGLFGCYLLFSDQFCVLGFLVFNDVMMIVFSTL